MMTSFVLSSWIMNDFDNILSRFDSFFISKKQTIKQSKRGLISFLVSSFFHWLIVLYFQPVFNTKSFFVVHCRLFVLNESWSTKVRPYQLFKTSLEEILGKKKQKKKTIIKWALWDTKGEEDLDLKQIQICISNSRSKMLIPGTI